MRTVNDVLNEITYHCGELPAPSYSPTSTGESGTLVGMAVPSMQYHMTDEGWQIFHGLRLNGWKLMGNNLDIPTRLTKMLKEYSPKTVLLQDKREWDVGEGSFRDPRDRFHNVDVLAGMSGTFRLTILKDAQQRQDYHRESAQEIGCHAWVVYYHPTIVKALAPYVRTKHLVRTYHTVDPKYVPVFRAGADRNPRAFLSGAVSSVYPLRQRLAASGMFTRLPHPGYHRNGCCTPSYLKELSKHKVAICTSSRFGFLLRKIVEAVACGCVVVTDLPVDDEVPVIDKYVHRVSPNITASEMEKYCKYLASEWDDSRQRYAASLAVNRFNFEQETARLSSAIELLRRSYNHSEGGVA